MKCKSCGAENPGDAVYCKECGAAVNPEQKTMVLDGGTRVMGETLSFSPGEFFGDRYQIIEEIGQGGMGTVFKARDKELDIVVALKMIKPKLGSQPDIVQRFKRELLLAREILHEHVIRIHDLGEVAGIKYISMNYIEGNSLDEILKSTGKLTVEKSIDITRQVCTALIAAHGKGIVHRDLKPQNIMIDKQGKAYVLDFGIARSLHTGESEGEIIGATQEGIVLGTPHFMSPEQIQGEKVDAGTDIYSLGIIMYEMVTGKLPFNAKSPAALLHMHLSEKPVPPCKLNPQCPPKLEKIILRCLEKKKKARYRMVEEVVQDLEQDKTVQIPPLKIKEEKESKPGSRFSKYGVRLLFLLFLIYAAISVSSLVTDSKFSVEIEKLKAESDTYYANYFPVQKEWLPGEWQTKDANAWDIYMELFTPSTGDAPQSNADGQRFAEAVRCSELNIYDSSNVSRALDLSLVRGYVDSTAASARADFLEGRYGPGLNKLVHLTVFSIDLFTAAVDIETHRAALDCFDGVCRELIPLLLCRELDTDSLLPYERDGLAAFGKIDPRFAPKVFDEPPVSEETKKAAAASLQSVVNLFDEALKKFEPHDVFYKEYLELGKKSQDIYGAVGTTETDYHIYKKVFYWKHWFSINRYYYREAIAVYLGLFDSIKRTRDMYDKSNIISDYFKNNVGTGNPLVVDGPQVMSGLVVSRTLGKLAAILSALNRFGPESKEFLELKGTNLFINERSGNPFELTGTGRDLSIVLGPKAALPLEKTDYRDGHKKILKYLKSF